MIIALDTVAWVFGIASLFSLIDVGMAKSIWRKLGRFFQFVVMASISTIYAAAYVRKESVPPPEVRIAVIALAVVSVGDIISRWSVNTRGNRE